MVFACLFTKVKAYPIIADYVKGHVTTTSMWILRRKGGLAELPDLYIQLHSSISI